MHEKLKALDKIFESASKSRFKKSDSMEDDDGLMTIKIVTSDPSKMDEIKKIISEMSKMPEGLMDEDEEEEYMV